MKTKKLWKIEDFGHDKVKVFDNGNKTFDRFTVYVYNLEAKDYDVYLR